MRIFRWIVIVLGTMLLIAATAVGCVVSNTLRDGALRVPDGSDPPDLRVVWVSAAEGLVRFATTEESDLDHGPWQSDGIWGVEWDGGYAQVGTILEKTGSEVLRSFIPFRGELHPGDLVRLDSFAYEGDPRQVHGYDFKDVLVPGPIGDLPAWFVDGHSKTWAIFVHGARGADREEALRVLPTFVDLGFPSLIISYRNDAGAPPTNNGFYHYGQTEWGDLEAAVSYALGHGAADVILVGFSTGGAHSVNHQYQSERADAVRAMVLDSPVLDFEDIIDYGGQQRGLPGVVMWLGKQWGALRFSIDWNERDYLSRADELNVPILLFQGVVDRTVHVRTSDELAERRPDLVTYVRVPNATHVRSWNVDPIAYEAHLRKFLGGVAN